MQFIFAVFVCVSRFCSCFLDSRFFASLKLAPTTSPCRNEWPKANRDTSSQPTPGRNELPQANRDTSSQPTPRRNELPQANRDTSSQPAPCRNEWPKANRDTQSKPTPRRNELPQANRDLQQAALCKAHRLAARYDQMIEHFDVDQS